MHKGCLAIRQHHVCSTISSHIFLSIQEAKQPIVRVLIAKHPENFMYTEYLTTKQPRVDSSQCYVYRMLAARRSYV
jgi:hypothetical protein